VKLRISGRAGRDIQSIALYTLQTWARTQVETYVGGLVDYLDHIASNPDIGRAIPKIPSRYRRVTFRSHFVFYRIDADTVVIVRILHQSMDHQRHLN
jgi:toxin ParE1/3/4